MDINFSKSNLKKLETILLESGFDIRYEKGHFQSGYCLVSSKKIILISRFFDTKARIESLLEIITQVEIREDLLSPISKKYLGSLAIAA